jgi:GNAT superfamily N-acetyltransferase
MKTLKVRPAAEDDEARVFALLKQFPAENIPGVPPLDWDRGKAAFREIVADEAKGTILVAVQGDLLLGICSLSYPIAVHCAGRYACIEEFIVSPNSRGKGVGGRLIEAAIVLATEQGCYEIQVNRPSEHGYPVYLRHGFRDAGKHLLLSLP